MEIFQSFLICCCYCYQEYYERRQKRLDKNKPKQVEDFLQSEPNKGEGKHFIEVCVQIFVFYVNGNR